MRYNIFISNIQKDYHDNIDIIRKEIIKLRVNTAAKKYHNKQIKTPIKKLQNNIIQQRTQLLRNKPKGIYKSVGANYETLKKHLEKNFADDMNWDNYGRGKLWAISYINHPRHAKTKKEVIKLNHYSNLIPEYIGKIHKERLIEAQYFNRNKLKRI